MGKTLFIFIMLLTSLTCNADIFDSIYKDSTLAKREKDSLAYEINELKLPTYIIGTLNSGTFAKREVWDTGNDVYFPKYLYVYIIGDAKDYYKCTYFGKCFYIKKDDLKCNVEISDIFNKGCDMYRRYFLSVSAKKSYESAIEQGEKYIKFVESHRLIYKDARPYDMSEYTDGTGYEVSFYNSSKKTIKYITFSIQGYNAVDDPIGRIITRKCIGPIESNEGSSYKFEYVWFSDLIETAKMISIKVQYMDNKIFIIKNAKSCLMPFLIGENHDLMNEMDEKFEDIGNSIKN